MNDVPLRNRRQFLADLGLTGLAGLAFWLQADAWAEEGEEGGSTPAPAGTRRGILRLHLQATTSSAFFKNAVRNSPIW